MVILAGTRQEKGVAVPYSLWSSDLDVFLRGRFPRPNENDGARVTSAAFSADGTDRGRRRRHRGRPAGRLVQPATVALLNAAPS